MSKTIVKPLNTSPSQIPLDMEESVLKNLICGLGDVTRLRHYVDPSQFAGEIGSYCDHWRHYNPRKPKNKRYGLSLTSLNGKMDGEIDLDSIFEYNKEHGTLYNETDFSVPTAAFHGLKSLAPLLNAFDTLGRTHIFRFDTGGFFPPHRDGFALRNNCFRVLVPLLGASENTWAFVLEGKVLKLNPWQAYFIDTYKEHSVFSFVDNCMVLVMNIPITEENYKCLMRNLEVI